MRAELFEANRLIAKWERGATLKPEQFVRVWESCATMGEVIAVTGLKRNSLVQRARRYRLRGVPLKYFPNTWDGKRFVKTGKSKTWIPRPDKKPLCKPNRCRIDVVRCNHVLDWVRYGAAIGSKMRPIKGHTHSECPIDAYTVSRQTKQITDQE